MSTSSLQINRDIILATKRQQIRQRLAKLPQAAVQALAEMQSRPRSLLNEVDDRPTVTLIGQINRTRIYDPVATAIVLVKNGAHAISLFTDHVIYDEDFDDLRMIARALPQVPILYQNYPINPYSVLSARGADASAMMFYASLMKPDELRPALTMAQRWGMAVLLQVKAQAELEQARALSPHVLCFGDEVSRTVERALRTLDELRPFIPHHAKTMLAQRLDTLRDVEMAVAAGVQAVIVSADLIRTESERLQSILRPQLG
jgi:indole-3-glycerol phosphate synthase